MSRPADPNAKDALVAAARAEFAKRGLRGARIEDITAACGLSKGAFYLHFESKEALFGELVEAFSCETVKASGLRRRIMAKIVDQYGPLTRRDVERRSPHYRALVELEQAEDYRLLEHIWAYRDVVGVLVAGAQGTVFEKTFWDMAEREVSRIKEDVGNFQQHHACRIDIPAEVFGSLIVGTWLLLGMRMSKMTEKPDLAEWARSIHTLIREGSLPRPAFPAPPAKRRLPAPSRRAAMKMKSSPTAPKPRSSR